MKLEKYFFSLPPPPPPIFFPVTALVNYTYFNTVILGCFDIIENTGLKIMFLCR